jgi:hypothetical protein
VNSFSFPLVTVALLPRPCYRACRSPSRACRRAAALLPRPTQPVAGLPPLCRRGCRSPSRVCRRRAAAGLLRLACAAGSQLGCELQLSCGLQLCEAATLKI